MDRNQTPDREESIDHEPEQYSHPWSVETIVVNGQPMTVTFPIEETS